MNITDPEYTIAIKTIASIVLYDLILDIHNQTIQHNSEIVMVGELTGKELGTQGACNG